MLLKFKLRKLRFTKTSSKKTLSAMSPLFTLFCFLPLITASDKLSAPTPIAPSNNSIIRVPNPKKCERVQFHWSAVSNAKGYETETEYVEQNGMWNSTYEPRFVDGTTDTIKFCDHRKYRWRVYAYDARDRAGLKSQWFMLKTTL